MEIREKNIQLTIEYVGTEYCGWQSQTNQKTIQDEIEKAISNVTGEKINLIGAGRTDSGVHALGQVANFRIKHNLEADKYNSALNFYLPDDIMVWQAKEVELDFHARFDAKHRRYRYIISTEPSALYRNMRWHRDNLSLDLLKKASEFIIGEHDFSAFCVTSSRKEDNRCRIDYSRWRQIGPLLSYEIRGNRFLHSMVRSLVGGMVNLATLKPDQNQENLTLESFKDIINAPDGRRNAFTAPAHGLYLVSVGY